MNFFDYIKNESFFKPFTLKYRRIYYDCIQLLIDKLKELPVLYESDARDSITIYLRNAEIRNMVRPQEPDDSKKTQDNSPKTEDSPPKAEDNNNAELLPSSILNIFRECGWVLPREIGRNGEYVVNISTDCRRIMDFLRKMTEKTGEGTMSNRIFAMYEITKSAFEEESVRAERPYANILIPLIDNEMELKNELTDLKDSIASIMKAVIIFQDINSFGQYIMKDEMLDGFFSEYFFVKNNGLIPTQISFIRSKLREIRQGELGEKMVTECAEKQQLSMEDARERVERYLAELQYFLSVEYEEHMELIDRRINSYYNLANTRIMLMASNGIRLETALNDFLNTMAGLTDEEQDTAMEKAAACTRLINQKYVGYKSFEKAKRVKNRGENIALPTTEMSEDEKRKRTENLFQSAPNRYSVERVSEYLKTEMEGQKTLHLREKNLRTKEEAFMYAAAMLYAGNREFPYKVRVSEEEVGMDIASISDMVISEK